MRLDTSAIQPQAAADKVEARLLASKKAPSILLSGMDRWARMTKNGADKAEQSKSERVMTN